MSGTHLELPTKSAGTGAAQPGDDAGTTPYIEPGRQIVIEVEDTSTNGGDVGIAVEYGELNRVPSDRTQAVEKTDV